jgi:hypothetical protein
VQQLLWIETVLKLAGGFVLLVTPGLAIKVLGLPRGDTFWPRLLGAVLIGIGGACYIGGAVPGAKGLGLAGAILINLAAASAIAAHLVLHRSGPSARGSAILWLLVGLLFVLSLAEIARA